MMAYTPSALQDRIYEEFSKPKWTNIIDALRPNGNLIVNILKELDELKVKYDAYNLNKSELQCQFPKRILLYPICLNLSM